MERGGVLAVYLSDAGLGTDDASETLAIMRTKRDAWTSGCC